MLYEFDRFLKTRRGLMQLSVERARSTTDQNLSHSRYNLRNHGIIGRYLSPPVQKLDKAITAMSLFK